MSRESRTPRRRGPGSTRITGGTLRGRALAVDAGVRPTEGRLREALFSIWAALVPGSRFLDLFAGSGAVGLEALSRGASEVWLVEGRPGAARTLAANVESLGAAGCRVLRAELPAGLARLGAEFFDLAFADPPYAFEDYEAVIAGAGEHLAAGGVLAVEHSRRRQLPQTAGELEQIDNRAYGDKELTFYRR